jgi:hypothetical protein
MDSTYKCTEFIEPLGKFYFKKYFEDSTYSPGEYSYEIGTKDKPVSPIPIALKFKFISNIDTINTYFPNNGKGNYFDSMINLNGVVYNYNPIHFDIECSYILKQLGESVIKNLHQNIIRVLDPCEDLNFSNSYRIFTVQFYKDYAKLYITLGRTVNYKGMQIIKKDSCILKQDDFEFLKKKLAKINNISDTVECREPGNPWILEYNNNSEYKCFIASYYCLQENKQKKKYLSPVTELYELIWLYARRNFRIDCTTLK